MMPWAEPMPDEQFDLMRRILAAPSPIGLEGAMTHGVLEPYFRSFMPKGWAIHRFRGNAGIVLDTMPEADPKETLSVMLIGHADKIRMQVRSIGDDGKIWVNSDSFLPQTLIGSRGPALQREPRRTGQLPHPRRRYDRGGRRDPLRAAQAALGRRGHQAQHALPRAAGARREEEGSDRGARHQAGRPDPAQAPHPPRLLARTRSTAPISTTASAAS